MIRRPPRSTQSRSSAASDVYKRQQRAPLPPQQKRSPQETDSTGGGATSEAPSSPPQVRSRGAGTFVDVGGDSVSTDRASLTDIAGPDEGNTRGYLVDGHAVGRGNHNRAIAPDNTPGSATVHTIGDRGFKLLRWSKAATIGVRPSEPCPSGPTAHV